jgi:hypothetical protein
MEEFEPREEILGNSHVEVRVANNSFGGGGKGKERKCKGWHEGAGRQCMTRDAQAGRNSEPRDQDPRKNSS